jgi:ketosteroid isomerase-like protein
VLAGDTDAVTSANLELVRSIVAAWERGDWSSARWAHPDIEFVRAEGDARSRSSGIADMATLWRDWLGAWQDFCIAEVEEYRELDDERVLVLHRFTGRGKTSGVEVDQTATTGASLFEIQDGKVTRLVAYAPRDEAFKDLSRDPTSDVRDSQSAAG